MGSSPVNAQGAGVEPASSKTHNYKRFMTPVDVCENTVVLLFYKSLKYCRGRAVQRKITRNATRVNLELAAYSKCCTAIGLKIEGCASYPSNEKSLNPNANISLTSGLIFITGNARGVLASCVATCSDYCLVCTGGNRRCIVVGTHMVFVRT